MINKAEEIKKLLDLYYDGKTTKSQEELLYDYFDSCNVPEELSVEKELFIRLKECTQEIPYSKYMEERFDKAIDRLQSTEVAFRRKKKIVWQAIGVAASMLMFGIVSVFVYRDITRNPYEVVDPQIAYAKTEEALLLVSEKLNKIDDKFAKADDILKKISKERK